MPEDREWDGWGTDGGMHNVHVSSSGCPAEEAVRRLVQHAREKYGVALDLSMWRFWVKEVGPTVAARTLHYRVDEGGRLVRVDS